MTKPKDYSLKDLVAQCDPDAPIPEELREWETAPAVGLEQDADWPQNMASSVADACRRSTKALEKSTHEQRKSFTQWRPKRR
jgi:hypothetical protein